MGWLGMLIGSYIGGTVGHLPGSILGAILGYKVQRILMRRYGSRRFASGRRPGRGDAVRGARDPLSDAYAVLGATPRDGVDELRRKYRELAKKYHPDALRAQGLPEASVGRATERMSRINAAWARIRETRGF